MPHEQWRLAFEDRYGSGAHTQLMGLFDQPCVTFADIAVKFGVTRERVRQWHRQVRPDAPRGHARQRLCVAHRQKKQLLQDPLFRAFYQHARPQVAAGRITLVRTRDGFTRRAVHLDGWMVAIKHARRQADAEAYGGKTAYVLINSQRAVDYIYYRLADDDYLLVPKTALPGNRTTFLDTPASKYQRFRNTFSAIPDARQAKRRSVNELGGRLSS
jgi:hypothetical protein